MLIFRQLLQNKGSPVCRIVLMMLISAALPGCAIGVKSTSLEDIHVKKEDAQLLADVGFVLDDELFARNNGILMDRERESWIKALSAFTDEKNIYVMAKGTPITIVKPPYRGARVAPVPPPRPDPAQLLSGRLPTPPVEEVADAKEEPPVVTIPFKVFEKTHPVVHVKVNAVPDEEELSGSSAISQAPLMISFLTFWVTPAHVNQPFMASFSLSLPEERKIPPAHWEYAYDRKEYYWLPLLPVAESTITVTGDPETDIDWQIEEKRRLVLKFLEDAKPLLQKNDMPK